MAFLIITLGFAFGPSNSIAEEKFALTDGDRVVLLGNALIEREQRYGYWETALTTRYPDKTITFRNLGWSGDTVWGEARAGFDTSQVGYRRLIERTLSVKPTVIVLGYGTNESFAGVEGLPRFREQFDKLLDDLAPTGARFVLLAPPAFEEVSWRAGHFAERQRDLKGYAEAIRQVAKKRRAWFADEFAQRYGPGDPLTDDGMHLTAYGYWWTTGPLQNELRVPLRPLKSVELAGLSPKQVLQDVLPNPPVPRDERSWGFQADSLVIVRDLKAGRYTLKIDGQAVHTADGQDWMKPHASDKTLVPRGPSLEQAEQLRKTIVEKNRLYFYRWRPQNETYLFGFRKHEQGQNAREIPQFDPLVDKLEQEIARLRKPVSHTYQLVPVGEEKK